MACLKAIAKKRNLLKADSELDVKRAAELFLTRTTPWEIGRLTLERVDEEPKKSVRMNMNINIGHLRN